MRSYLLRIGGIAIVIVFLASGCAGQRVRPTAESIIVPKAPVLIPVTIGIAQVEPDRNSRKKVEGPTDLDLKLAGGFSDVVHDFKKYLDESGLFQMVLYPMRPDDRVDGTIALLVKTKVKSDGWAIPKAVVTGAGYFIPEPVIYYNDRFEAQCSLNFIKGRRHLKTYTGEGAIVASHKLLYYPDQLRHDGTEAAGKLLWANIIEQLISDGTFLAHELMPNPGRDQYFPIPNQSLMLGPGGQ